ncbi:histone H1/H5 family protein [Antennarius striatus]|uniref:histone H1/H5 family protein n=1 Tax=Antennarius striatus TaxID=241820 RepID=UPI0035B1EA66
MSSAKSQQKRSPSVSDLLLKAAAASSQRGGVSLAALKRALERQGYDVAKNRARILIAIKRLVANKTLIQTKGSGASGSFKLNKNPPTPREKRVAKKTPKKKRRTVSVQKTPDAAAPAPQKSPKEKKKKKTAKTPMKAKRSSVTKKPKSLKTVRRAVRSIRTRSAVKK